MKPTPTQIEAAARRLAELEGLNPDERASELHTGLIWEEYKDSAEAILCAALSVAVGGEPVAWISEHKHEKGRFWLSEPNGHGDAYWSDAFPVYRAAPSAPHIIR